MRVKQKNRIPRLGRWCLLLCVLFWAGLSWSDPLKLSTPLKLAASSWPPYIGRDLPNQGIAVEIVTKAFNRAKVKIEVVMIPTWKEVREGMEVGVYDIILGTWYSDERARFHQFSEPFMMNRLSFIKPKGSDISFNTLADLEGLMIATVNDYAYGDEFDTYPGIYQVKSNHVVQSLMNLMGGRADLALGDEWVMRHELKNYMPGRLKDIEVIQKPLSEKGLRIAMSLYNEKGARTLEVFNMEVSKMKKEGVIDTIIASHKKYYQ
jgi:polar amino acid transport system substrate-binding protein